MSDIVNGALLARDEAFRDRALIAAVRQALAVMAEPEDTPNRTFRQGYASSLLKGPAHYQDTVVWVLAADPTVAAEGATSDEITDAVMSARVAAVWNYLAALA